MQKPLVKSMSLPPREFSFPKSERLTPLKNPETTTKQEARTLSNLDDCFVHGLRTLVIRSKSNKSLSNDEHRNSLFRSF